MNIKKYPFSTEEISPEPWGFTDEISPVAFRAFRVSISPVPWQSASSSIRPCPRRRRRGISGAQLTLFAS
ncbi:hypothetical protein HanPSC8_Chr07g0271021 [Helianthus annuus]|nr:hypothetical protein HanPSC8_Chr07g0271021 [Helianthus annuus]